MMAVFTWWRIDIFRKVLRKMTSFAKMESWQVAEEVILQLRKVLIRNNNRNS